MWSYLPEEIILNILSRLQVKTLFRFRCVCKSWSKLLTSNNLDFVKKHLNHVVDEKNKYNKCSLLIHFEDFYLTDSVSSELCICVRINTPFYSTLSIRNEVLGPCNGLLCNGPDFRGNYFIWNPSTNEYKKISQPTNTSRRLRNNYYAYGFGYETKIDDYKLVRIVSSFGSVNNLELNVYTLGSNSWRNVQSVPHNPFAPKRKAGVFLNGALHWIQVNIESLESQVIVSFDIGDERFQDIELPNYVVDRETSNVGVLRGDLCLLDLSNDSHDVWVMKDYGVIESWTKLFSIARDTRISYYYKLVHSFNNGDILFWVQLNEEDDFAHVLVSYDPEHGRTRMLKTLGSPLYFDNVVTYVESLVSPNRVLL